MGTDPEWRRPDLRLKQEEGRGQAPRAADNTALTRDTSLFGADCNLLYLQCATLLSTSLSQLCFIAAEKQLKLPTRANPHTPSSDLGGRGREGPKEQNVNARSITQLSEYTFRVGKVHGTEERRQVGSQALGSNPSCKSHLLRGILVGKVGMLIPIAQGCWED